MFRYCCSRCPLDHLSWWFGGGRVTRWCVACRAEREFVYQERMGR